MIEKIHNSDLEALKVALYNLPNHRTAETGFKLIERYEAILNPKRFIFTFSGRNWTVGPEDNPCSINSDMAGLHYIQQLLMYQGRPLRPWEVARCPVPRSEEEQAKLVDRVRNAIIRAVDPHLYRASSELAELLYPARKSDGQRFLLELPHNVSIELRPTCIRMNT